ncbi:MAG: hypothetical protein M1812_000830 [Candelaria pacifica]|nr:MAG: hypothetical protein M1812_000830 [Candelaria pacifica]
MSKPRENAATVREQETSPLPIRTTKEANSQQVSEGGYQSLRMTEDVDGYPPTEKTKSCSRCKKDKGASAFLGGFKTCITCRKGKSDDPLTAVGTLRMLGDNPPTGLRSGAQPGNGSERRSGGTSALKVATEPIGPPSSAAEVDDPQTIRATLQLAEEDIEVKSIEEALKAAAQVASQKACANLLKAEIASAEIADRVHKAAILEAGAKLKEIKKQQEDDEQKAAVTARRINLLKRK